MKILYLDCAMGAAGDMLAAALADLLDDQDAFVRELNELNIPGVNAELSAVSRSGIIGKSLSVLVNDVEEDEHFHHGHSLNDIEHIVGTLNTSADIKKAVMDVYEIIADAESKVHGKAVDEIHFHEVGMLDAVADIAAVCLAMRKLSPEKIMASSVHVGSGNVKCAHGVLPVPAPATAEILKGIPIYGGKIRGELCTPTGAALLKYFVSEFGNMPELIITDTGYGMGKKEFEAVNCVRAILGESVTDSGVVELRANIDDMTGEDIAFAAETILSEGALDVWTENIGMKKSRPGIMLCVLCEEYDSEKMAGHIFKHTTTLGVRQIKCTRKILSRKTQIRQTKLGAVAKKVSEGYGVRREKYEYEDVAKIAKENKMSVAEIKEMLSALER